MANPMQALRAKQLAHSLEFKFLILCSIPVISLLCVMVYIVHTQSISTLSSLSIAVVLLAPTLAALTKCYNIVINLLNAISTQLDSINGEEYNIWQLAQYKSGRVAALKSDIKQMSKRIHKKRQEYVKNESFVFHFISELSLPVVILDAHQHVYHANTAAHDLFKCVTLQGLHCSDLNLENQSNRWQIKQQASRYTLATHHLHRGSRTYEILVFVTLEQILRENEKFVWQKLITVMNHEVRNSLTPICSMAQSLRFDTAVISSDMRDTMLEVIASRATHLQKFISSYASIAQLPQLSLSAQPVQQLVEHWQTLYPELQVSLATDSQLLCDGEQLTQALINLLNNAQQANTLRGKSTIQLAIERIKQTCVLTLEDHGCGIDNTANLFVPFYSTKQGGTGIGLIISREIIRNHGGELTLTNKPDGHGARAVITLPATAK